MVTDHDPRCEWIRSPALYPAELRAHNTLRPTFRRVWDFCGYTQLPLRFLVSSEDLIHRVELFKRTFHPIGSRVHVLLRHGDRGVAHDLHDREGVGLRSRLTQTGSEGMPQRMYHKFLRQFFDTLLGFDLRLFPCAPVLVIERG